MRAYFARIRVLAVFVGGGVRPLMQGPTETYLQLSLLTAPSATKSVAKSDRYRPT